MAREGNRLIESEERWRDLGIGCRICKGDLTYSEYRDLGGLCHDCNGAMDPDGD